MANDLVLVPGSLEALRDEIKKMAGQLPNLEQAVLKFIRYFPGRFHFVLSSTPDETRAMILKEIPTLNPDRLQVVHPFIGTTGWASHDADTALSSLVVVNDSASFNQICCRLRHPSAVYYVWGKFSCSNYSSADRNAGTIRAMSPHLFRWSCGDLHLYLGLRDIEGLTLTFRNEPSIGV